MRVLPERSIDRAAGEADIPAGGKLMTAMLAAVRLVHPAPTAAVVILSAALGAVLLAQAGGPVPSARLGLTVTAVLGSQILTGALNDWADRQRDTIAQPTKPIPAGHIAPRAALGIAATGLAIQVGASMFLGPLPLALGLAAAGSAVAYNLRLSRTPASFLPYLVSFGLLPLWIAAGVGTPLDRVAATPWLIGPFAVAAHFANALRDFDADASLSSRNLAQVLGQRTSFRLAWGLAMAVGVGVGAALVLGPGRTPAVIVLGALGLTAVAQGGGSPQRLWSGMLVAAVCWTAAWALATG
ncbi:MAG: UbiA family prenyltransferase [Candidatus Limnocylindria bacterium]